MAMNATPEQTVSPDVLLSARGMSAGYHKHPVVVGIDLEVRAGEVVALLGPNGAGKTTTLLALSGELPPLEGEVTFRGEPATAPLHRRARNGLAFVTEERSVFPQLTAGENLKIGRGKQEIALALFPELEPLLDRRGGLLSGGEQQMLTLARALSREPVLLLADELSLGLAPLVVARLLKAVRAAADERGVGVLLVEQHVKQAMRIADRVLVMRGGRIVLSGKASEVEGRLEEAYLSGGLDETSLATSGQPATT
jgi:branched-chain amino acid transport system ATP-binding protein